MHPADPRPNPRHRLAPALPWLATAGALVLLAVAMAAVRLPLRAQLRQQLAQRDAQVLARLIQQQIDDPEAAGGDPLAAVLAASLVPDLPGVRSLQVYSPEGQPFANLLGSPESPDTPPQLGEPPTASARYSAAPTPHLDVWIPLRHSASDELLGIARMSLDAGDLAHEFETLDQSLLRQSFLAFAAIGGTLATVLLLAFRSLARANRLLAEQSHRLELANRELSLAARTSAVGAIASHLVHGLRNPLAALQIAVSDQGSSPDAAASARRMRDMIDDVVRVLRDEQGLAAFEIHASEIVTEAIRRCRLHLPAAQGIRWHQAAEEGPSLDNRAANLALLVLDNLIANAVQAAGGHADIRIVARPTHGAWQFEVEDDGPGIPPGLAERLFLPVASGKPGSSGIGLAISRQLARHLGGDLRLVHSRPGSTRFALTVPVSAPAPA